MRLIVLAAGHGYALDGMVKCLVPHPRTGKTLLEHTMETFHGMRTTVVVGYRAVEIMGRFPRLEYVYNADWAATNNSYSLALTLDDEPCIVCSSDFIFDERAMDCFDDSVPDAALVSHRASRPTSAVNCVVDENGHIHETYVGPLRSQFHPEAIGVFRIETTSLLREWKSACLEKPNLFVGQNLPLSRKGLPVMQAVLPDRQFFCEINTPVDYLRLIDAATGGKA